MFIRILRVHTSYFLILYIFNFVSLTRHLSDTSPHVTLSCSLVSHFLIMFNIDVQYLAQKKCKILQYDYL